MRDAIAAEQPLEIVGHGSKRAIGRPTATNAVLDLSALNAITSYEPNELIVTVQAGAPMADLLVADRFEEPGICLRSNGHIGAAGNSARRRDHRRHHRRGSRGSAAHQGRRRARSPAWCSCGLGLRRVLQDRRQSGQERDRLRPLQAAGGIVGHAVGHDRGSRSRFCPRRRASARWCCAASTTLRPPRAMTVALGIVV